MFAENEVEVPTFTPLVRARMTTINGESVKEREPTRTKRASGSRIGKRTCRGPPTLVRATKSSTGNGGRPNTRSAARVDRRGIRDERGLAIGDRLKFFVAGREVDAEIASIRKVNWDSFQPNFFLVLSPGALDGMPTTFISSMRIAEEKQPMLIDLMRKHPSISVIDLGAILQQVRGIIEKASLAVQAVFMFTLGRRYCRAVCCCAVDHR